jgi:hypothetical protein
MSDESSVKRELQIQRFIILALIGGIVFLGFRLFHSPAKALIAHDPAPVSAQITRLPYYEKIMAILDSLEYSGVADLMKPAVDLQIDFAGKIWTLTNIHEFDPQGNILLNHDRYGLCGELAAYTYQKIDPFLKDRYEILFLKAAESGFFLRPRSTHIVLMMVDRSTRERYFIDPSFRRYGREADFSDYLFSESADLPTHLKSLTKDVPFPADGETPLLIRKNFLLCLGAESVGGKFDKDNFALALTANKRHAYSGRYVFTLRRQDGKSETFKNAGLLNQLLTPEEIRSLCGKITGWFEAASQSKT